MKRVETLPAGADAVVIGGGIIGAATAFFLSREGIDTLLLERRPALCSLTTAVAGGGYRLQQDNEEDFRLVEASLRVFEEFSSVTGQDRYQPDLRRQGYLWVTRTEAVAERQRALVEAQRGWGLQDVELLEGPEARKRFPYLAGEVLQARYRGDDGFIDPRAVTLGFAEGSSASAALRCSVEGIEATAGGLALATTSGRVEAEAVIIAAGPFSGVVAATAGVELPVTLVRRQKLVMPEVPEVPPEAPMTIDEDTGAHWRPDYTGATAYFTDPSTPPTPPTEEVPLDHSFLFGLLDPKSPTALARVSPFWRSVWERGSDPWVLQAGQYTMTPDRRPLIGALDDGLYVNTGYCGHGVMCSAAGAKHLAEVLTGKTSLQENPYRPDRGFQARPRLDPL